MSGVRLPNRWRKFVETYSGDLAYWYVPKGLAVTAESVRPRLELLREFEGRVWRDAQADYIARLNEAGVSGASSHWRSGGAPLARMLKQVFATLGLAWVNDRDRVELTRVGRAFLSSSNPNDVLSDQVFKYQFWNPTIVTKRHRTIRLHPVPFLGEVPRTVDGLSHEEYILFVSRAKSYDEVDDTVDKIVTFRNLDDDLKIDILNECCRYRLAGTKRLHDVQ